jgi:uncharacterized protein
MSTNTDNKVMNDRNQIPRNTSIAICTQFVYTSSMKLEWDENKRLSNLTKHGLDFCDVWAIFEGPHIVVPSVYPDEPRFLVIGVLNNRHVAAVCTMRGDAVRVISLRRARNEEKQHYEAIHSGGA